jgi:xanthine dehydrogenase small subunit
MRSLSLFGLSSASRVALHFNAPHPVRMADNIRFTLNDGPVELSGVSPMTTLLDWLREQRGLKGTKEGCGEGDCGACTVVLEREGRREAVNSCIALLGQVDGLSVRTVEGLRGSDGGAHAVQTAMAEADATQCGFCTPGFVMSAYAFAAGAQKPDLETIHDALAGNLCRCTGYRPIVEAMTRVAGLPVEPVPVRPAPVRPARAGSAVFGEAFFAPRSLAELLTLRAKHPEALLLAGATDLGLLASRSRKPPASVIHLAHVPELTAIADDKEQVTIGAAATYAAAMPTLIAAYPGLKNYLARLGSRQIRSLGTIGGNIGTASPIGDMPPVLLALEAGLRLVSSRGPRDLPLEEFFLGYRKTALAPDEVIQSISMPKLWPGEVFFCDKVSKRRDQDISTVAAGYRLRIKDGRVEDVRIGFGGMAATPKRARHVEAALLKEGFAAAVAAVPKDFRPIDDMRGSAAYRLQVAANLLRRLELRIAEPGRAVEVEAL